MNSLLQAFKIPELRHKILMLMFFLATFRVMAAVPIPGVDLFRLQQFFSSNELFGFLNIFSGGGLANLSIVMLGVGPHITAVIIMQLLTLIFPQLKKIYYEEGAEGRAKFNRYSRYLTVPLAAIQSYGFLNLLISQQVIDTPGIGALLTNVAVITAGSIFVMWLGELISEYKIGNGISIIIFAGIVAGLPQMVTTSLATYTPAEIPTYITFVVLTIIITAGIVFVNEGERKVPVSYAKQIRGNKMYGGASSYLPIKVNQAGVIPIIFAISVLLFPQFIAQLAFLVSPGLSESMNDIVMKFFDNIWLYSGAYFFLVVAFTFFYTNVTFDPESISKNLQRRGGFIPGIRPGAKTTESLRKIVNRITFSGALFLGIVAILPNVTQILSGIEVFAIGGAALLIVVAVALDIMKQIESQLVIREYDNL